MTKPTASEIFEIQNVAELGDMAKAIVGKFSEPAAAPRTSATVIGLYGNLGAGKTAFTQLLAKELGITEQLTSPTFVIQKNYSIEENADTKNKNDDGNQPNHPFTKLVHIDAYRLHKGSELNVLGWNETLRDPKTLVCIEWPENVIDAMPPHIKIELQHAGEGKRKMIVNSIFTPPHSI